jgi:hypothetical protein
MHKTCRFVNANGNEKDRKSIILLFNSNRSAIQNGSLNTHEINNKLRYKPMFILFMYLLCALILVLISLWTHYVNSKNMKKLDELNSRCQDHLNKITQQLGLDKKVNLEEQEQFLLKDEDNSIQIDEKIQQRLSTLSLEKKLIQIPSILMENPVQHTLISGLHSEFKLENEIKPNSSN